jgi:hypothetical protein
MFFHKFGNKKHNSVIEHWALVRKTVTKITHKVIPAVELRRHFVFMCNLNMGSKISLLNASHLSVIVGEMATFATLLAFSSVPRFETVT